MEAKSEFFKAAYWKFEGRMIRLTSFNERTLPDHELAVLAFHRARAFKLEPLYKRVFFGEFLRFGRDDWQNDQWLDEAKCHV